MEEARKIRWEGLVSSQARLERAEHEHALLLFQYEDRMLAGGGFNDMQLGSIDWHI
jgi:hypothetical protein